MVAGFDSVGWWTPAFRPGHVTGDLGQSVGEITSLLRIEDADGSSEPVVVCEAGKHDAIASGNGHGLGEMVWPDTLIAPEGGHVGSILIDGPEALDPPKGLVRVFPSGIDDAAVVQQRGQPVRFAVAADEVDVSSVRIAARQDVGIGVGHAADVRVASGGGEHDVPIGQVDGVDVVVVAKSKLLQARAINVDLVEVKALFVPGPVAKENFSGIEGKVETPEAARLFRRELANLSAGAEPVEHEQTSARHGHHPIAVACLMGPLPSLRKRIVNEHHLSEIHHGILEHDSAFHSAHGEVEILRFFVDSPYGFFTGCELCFDFFQQERPIENADVIQTAREASTPSQRTRTDQHGIRIAGLLSFEFHRRVLPAIDEDRNGAVVNDLSHVMPSAIVDPGLAVDHVAAGCCPVMAPHNASVGHEEEVSFANTVAEDIGFAGPRVDPCADCVVALCDGRELGARIDQ